MEGWWAQRPFAVAFVLLWLIAMARGQATYWLARGATGTAVRHTTGADGWRGRLHDWLDGDQVARGRRSLERGGLPMISLAYLTVGFQTLVIAAAGVLRIQWARFTVAQVVGALAWAGIYATIGFAAWRAAMAATARSPWALMVLAVAAVVLVTWALRRRHRRRDHSPATSSPDRSSTTRT